MARAFARKSKILILDEATANYDAQSEAYVNQILTTDFIDSTVIVISHKPNILSKVDKIWFINNGNINQFENYKEFENSYNEARKCSPFL